MRRLKIFYALPILFVCGLGLYWASEPKLPVRQISSQPFASAQLKGLTARFFTAGNQLRPSGNDLFIEFRDAQSNLVDVGNATFEMSLKMPDMVMHSIGKVLRTATPGQYRTTIEPQMAGAWTAEVGIDNARGHAETNFPMNVK